MTQAEFDKKWGSISTDDMTDEQFVEFKNDCFEYYEGCGFLDKFDSPYDQEKEHNGMSFKVIRRATTEECDLEAMPLWLIEFENGDTAYCYPEEICKEDAEDVAKREWAELQEYNGKSVEEIRSTFGKDITNDDGEHIDLNYKDILVTFNVSDGIVSLSDCVEVYNSEGVFCNVFYV